MPVVVKGALWSGYEFAVGQGFSGMQYVRQRCGGQDNCLRCRGLARELCADGHVQVVIVLDNNFSAASAM